MAKLGEKGAQISDAKGSRENKGGIVSKGKNPNGVCVAMCAMWLKNVLTHAGDTVLGDPSKKFRYNGVQQLAEGLFARYKIIGMAGKDFHEGKKKLFAAQGIKMDEVDYKFGTCKEAFAFMRDHRKPVAMSIGVPGHAMAAYLQGPKCYFFDPNEGVYEYNNARDFYDECWFFSFFEYCNWQAEEDEWEVFAYPVTIT